MTDNSVLITHFLMLTANLDIIFETNKRKVLLMIFAI